MADRPLATAAKAREARQAQGGLPTRSLSCDPSVAHLGNWIPVPNPFNLTAPPPWWLQLIYDYDRDLVVFPSRNERVYRLARRARISGGLPGDFPIHHPDTAIMKQHRLVSVSSLSVQLVQSAAIIPQLRDRDLWRFSPDELGEIMDARDRAREEKDDQYLVTRGAEYHREARRTWKARTGATAFMVGGKKSRRPMEPAPDYLKSVTIRPSHSPAAVAGPATATSA